MEIKLGIIATSVAVTTGAVQLFWGLASGSYNAGSRMESMQTELKLLRNEIQNQSRLFQAQNEVYEFRLTKLEELKTARLSKNERDR